MNDPSRHPLERIHALAPERTVRIMNVCGGHERTLTHAGLRAALPPTVRLIAGPGCPVCICPEQDIHTAIQLALSAQVTLVAFGDLLRVPVNVAVGQPRSLAEAQAAGADVRAIASPAEALTIAAHEPGREVVFLAAGFETTMAPVAAMLLRGHADRLPDNLSLLLSGRRTWPAVELLLSSGASPIDALIAPGHVATVMGADEWRFVPERHHLPTAIAGFSATALLEAIAALLEQLRDGRCTLDNCYPQTVDGDGNRQARDCLQRAFDIVDAEWRGIGVIARSGYRLAASLQAHDARQRHPLTVDTARRRAGQMPPGCDCAAVVLGRIDPNQCRLYGAACTPQRPVGPCMVSDEGACRIWWSAGLRHRRRPEIPAVPS